MSRTSLLALLAPLVLGVSSLYADPTVEFSGQIRVREELRHELFSPADPTGEESGDEAHLRARLRADAAINDQLGATVELQDVRLLGSEGSTVADTEGVDLKRGYFLVTPSATDLSIKVGRWVMAYGGQRLIGHLEWVDQGRSYDGVHVSYKPDASHLDYVDAFAVRVRETLDAKDDLHFGGIYGALNLSDGLKLELYALGLRDALGDGVTFATLGSRAVLKRGPIDGNAEAAVQLGEVGDSELVAVAAALEAGYTIANAHGLRVGGEIAYASGDGDPNDDSDNTFRTLFPTNHLYYGYADLAAWQNLLAFRLRVSAAPRKNVTVSLDAHHLRLAEAGGGWFNAGGALVRPGDITASSTLGNEIDGVVGWKPIDNLALSAGVALFVSGGFVDDTGGGGNALFAYLQGVARF